MEDRLNYDLILSLTKAPHLEVFEDIDSTNDYAKRVADRVPGGSLFVSDHQTGGRGRNGKPFFSPKGTGVYFTILLKDVGMNDAVNMTTVAAVAVARAIEDVCGKVPSIKWVNDVYLGGRKICGILAETQGTMEKENLPYMVTGIGMNVYETNFPDDLRDIATYILPNESGMKIRNELVSAVYRNFMEMVSQFPERKYLGYYRERSNTIGRRVSFTQREGFTEGKAIDIDDDGGLIVEVSPGRIITLNSGEISIKVRNYNMNENPSSKCTTYYSTVP